jgi:hypothetical protein
MSIDKIIADYPIESELDFLVACIVFMRQEKNPRKSLVFKKEMEQYFRLSSFMRDSQLYDELVRLASTKAGTMKERDINDLKKIHEMYRGSYFRLDGRLCVFQEHKRYGAPTEGWFTYHYVNSLLEQTLDYDEAWSFLTEGMLTLGIDS